jgi:hypothetical protein
MVTELGVNVNQYARGSFPPVFIAAMMGHVGHVRCIIKELGAKVIWPYCITRIDDPAFKVLLRIMVLYAAPPSNFARISMSTVHFMIVERGALLRAAKPSYVEQQRALIADHCPLPAVLLPCVASYPAPTHDDMWTDWARWM